MLSTVAVAHIYLVVLGMIDNTAQLEITGIDRWKYFDNCSIICTDTRMNKIITFMRYSFKSIIGPTCNCLYVGFL